MSKMRPIHSSTLRTRSVPSRAVGRAADAASRRPGSAAPERRDSSGADAWERFWFSPAAPRTLVVQRVGFALLTILFYLGYWSDVAVWFGADGLLGTERLGRLVAAATDSHSPQWNLSPLYWVSSEFSFRAYMAAGIGLATALALVLGGRVVAVLAWLAWLGLANRGWVVAGAGEVALGIGLAAMALAGPMPRWPWETPGRRWTYGLAARLMWVHALALVVIATVARWTVPEAIGAGGIAGVLLTWTPLVGLGMLVARPLRVWATLVLVAHSVAAGIVTGDALGGAAVAVLLLGLIDGIGADGSDDRK